MYRILAVEDEEDIQEILKNYLTDQGYLVTLADDGVDGIAKFHSGEFDLILLDVMLPKIDGFGVCELIRRESDVPVIMLTALEEEEYQIRGLDLKADDYITKPFSMPVLLRKIAAVLRRTHREEEQQVITYKTLRIDLMGHHVFVCEKPEGEEEVELTQKEFELLHVLLINKGIVLTRQKLLNMVWGMDYFGEERIVDTHIKNIRKKLGQEYIRTIRGVGYRIDKENQR
ncbi:MAG: response regulator transcription factor [Lachnospiraceae bacterium]|nr:response regulator transcription factor [Lachnospiraceae bacterium]